MMDIFPFAPRYQEAWQVLCAESGDAWFWHTRDWWEYSRAFIGKALLSDMSLVVIDEGTVVALVSAMLMEDQSGEKRIGLGDQPIPWPVYSPRLTEKQIDRVEKQLFDAMEARANEHSAQRVDWFGVIPAKCFFDAKKPLINRPLRYGYVGSDYISQVIDLRETEVTLWSGVRKGHKSAIKSARKRLDIDFFYGQISDEQFAQYQYLHSLAAGRNTRHSETFLMMRAWIEHGNGLLVRAKLNGQSVGFAYFILYSQSAFYASAANHPDFIGELSIGHALIWEAILKCRSLGVHLVEMGLQTFASSTQNSKLANISNFKRGFGGYGLPRFIASKRVDNQ